jgi:hypothetical protein
MHVKHQAHKHKMTKGTNIATSWVPSVDDFPFGGFRDRYGTDFFDSGHKWIYASS